MLSTIDLTRTLTKEEYIRDLIRYQLQLRALAYQLYVQKRPLLIVYEGWDAGGKGGNIKRITEKLAGNHAMFSSPETIRMIQMCDNCRIQAQYHSQNNPFAGAERPRDPAPRRHGRAGDDGGDGVAPCLHRAGADACLRP